MIYFFHIYADNSISIFIVTKFFESFILLFMMQSITFQLFFYGMNFINEFVLIYSKLWQKLVS